jgi:hypothetical protein
MSDHEDEVDVEPTSEPTGKGGPFGWLTGGTAFVKAMTGLVSAAAVLVAGLAGAGLLGGGDDAKGTTTVPSGGTTTVPGGGFSDPPGLFQAVTRAHGRAYFEDTALLVTALRPSRPFVHLADIGEQQDVGLAVTEAWNSGSPDFGVGPICRYQGAGTYYLLSVLSGGRFNVMRYEGGEGRSLTGGIKQSSAVRDDANDVAARCVGDATTVLTLTVNGRQVARARDDDGLAAGGVGLRVGSSEARVTCRFERFVLRTL